jgi:hypothetical protein
MVYSGDTLSFFIDGKPFQVDSTMLTFEDVKAELKSADPDVDRLIALTTPALAIAQAVEAVVEAEYLPRGTVGVTTNSVTYNGEEVAGVLVDRILSMLSEGFDIMPMVRFMENLYQNPADFARDELYLWLETSNLPITEDGYFLAYKNVRSDFKSIHGGQVDNSVGTIVSMPRNAVDDDRNRTCSAGLHFCSPSYLPHFSHSYGGHTVLLKINPADVVSIPSDYDNAKGRAWKYEVLSVVGEDPQTKVWPSVVSPTAGAIEPKRGFDPASAEAKHLFSLLNQIGLQDRDDRLDWAYDVLTDNGVEDWIGRSFNDLTIEDVEILTERAEADVAEMEAAKARSVIAAAPKPDPRIEAEKARINALGIIALRREASKAGFQGAWKGPKAKELQDYLISRI